ncbi:bZIP transcription factor 11-like [Andrographis paniculata]|uniref:bZIP transcription factor 11-like n=1 Tax=Andrographis paniculata TaxID=175694 RepID=UPI0021E71FD5|nr:bZIP transcription factor 11-like [Andrographis paniculata]
MSYSAGNSSSSPPIQSSGSDEDPRVDERKRKRMESNRESARRSRQRKQKHLDELAAQVTQLKQENGQISNTINLTTQQYAKVESDNSVLRAQMTELSQRLQSLNDILNYINSSASSAAAAGNCMLEVEDFQLQGFGDGFWNSNPWNSTGINQHPIMASAEMFMDY